MSLSRLAPWLVAVVAVVALAGTRCPPPRPPKDRPTPTATPAPLKPAPGLQLAQEQAQALEQRFEAEARDDRDEFASRIDEITALDPQDQREQWLELVAELKATRRDR